MRNALEELPQESPQFAGQSPPEEDEVLLTFGELERWRARKLQLEALLDELDTLTRKIRAAEVLLKDHQP